MAVKQADTYICHDYVFGFYDPFEGSLNLRIMNFRHQPASTITVSFAKMLIYRHNIRNCFLKEHLRLRNLFPQSVCLRCRFIPKAHQSAELCISWGRHSICHLKAFYAVLLCNLCVITQSTQMMKVLQLLQLHLHQGFCPEELGAVFVVVLFGLVFFAGNWHS